MLPRRMLAYVREIQEDADRLMTKVCQVREVITTGGTQEPSTGYLTGHLIHDSSIG